MAKSNTPRTLSKIQDKIDRGDVVILTAQEICDRVRNGEILKLDDVDVVTTATCALMSGTYAVLSFKVAEPETFTKAEKVWINNVPAQVGPCPNERIGILDLIIMGTATSKVDPGYGGGNLFYELVSGKKVRVEIQTSDGLHFTASTTLKQIPHAVLHGSRNAFKNYLAFVNPGKEKVSTIFHSEYMRGNYEEMTFCGCGELNPLENDPELKSIGKGTRVLINGAQGYVTGPGTRSSAENPNLSGYADMHQMNPEYMGGFITGNGPDSIMTWAVAIPVLDRQMLNHILKTDDQIPLKVVDVRNRTLLFETTYGDVWGKTDHMVKFHPKLCLACDTCQVENICPVKAVFLDTEKILRFDGDKCFHCGLCVSRCRGESFSANLGGTTLSSTGKKLPVTLRQSNRKTALKAAEELKAQILDRQFKLTEPLEKIKFPDGS